MSAKSRIRKKTPASAFIASERVVDAAHYDLRCRRRRNGLDPDGVTRSFARIAIEDEMYLIAMFPALQGKKR